MNRIYRLVWNHVSNNWVCCAENAKGRSKSSSVRSAGVVNAMAAVLAGTTLFSPWAQAGPTGAQVSVGSGSVTQTGSNTTINQTSQSLAINWQSFGIAGNESVNFVQPNAGAIALNRVVGQSPSQILGSLSANGQVFILNPNGVLFGAGSQVNVGGLVASTQSLGDADFMAGRYSFSAASGSTASVVNQGTLTAAKGGYVALLAPEVRNQGVISARLGTALLAAGENVTLQLNNGSLLGFNIDKGALKALVDNQQLVVADGGQVFMSAKAADTLSTAVVNNSGVIEARTVESHNGTIRLLGDMATGTVNISGTLDAGAPTSGSGGFIETSAAQVKIADSATITTRAANGLNGTWLIDPVDFTIAASGGDITGAQLGTLLASTSVTIQTQLNLPHNSFVTSIVGSSGSNGDIFVNDPVSWSANTLTLHAYNNIHINSVMNASASAGLALQYGQGAGNGVVNGVTSSYSVNAPVNIASTGSFSTMLGSNGATINYTIINSLGQAGSTTGTDLQGINGALNGNYVLGSDIQAGATSGWNAGAGFAPIGTFNGNFDGLGHTITGLVIVRPTENNVGLFSVVAGSSTISNLGLVGGSVSGNNYVGALVGFNNGNISTSYATGSVSGSGNFAGGLVGFNYGAISASYATGSISGGNDVGGLAGFNYGNSISNSYATGSVSGNDTVGGLVGLNGNGGTLVNSYATGNVIGNSGNVGGLTGGNSGTISTSYATGSVSGNGYGVGGLVGLSDGAIDNSYATGNVSGNNAAGGLVGDNHGTISSSYWNSVNTTGVGVESGLTTGSGGLTAAQMQDASNFTGFTFTSTPGGVGWVIVNGDGTLNNSGTNGGGTHPMLVSEYSTTIRNAHQLQLMAMNTGASYTLAINIDATATGSGTDVWGSAGFVPVGNYNNAFAGSLEGLGRTINGLNINLSGTDYVGLLGYTGPGAVVQNVALVGGNVSGRNYVGGLVGANYGTVNNSSSSANVSGSNFVGGLVGANYGAISNSFATGNVNSSADKGGGLVGYNYGGSISSSYATGIVSGVNNVGGLVGEDHQGTINGNSYATGSVSATGSSVGGLIGHAYGSTISSSSATGPVSGNNDVGGLVGFNEGNGMVTNSMATGTVNGITEVGGLVGYNNGTISNSYATGNVNASVDIAGGLVGSNFAGGTISNSYATGNVNATGSNTGGLVGFNYGGTISSSSAMGSVNGSSNVGGLVGQNQGTIDGNSYATGNVNATGSSAGGLVGFNSGGTISSSSAIGSVSGSNYVGGLVGQNQGTVSNSYATGAVHGNNYVGGLVGFHKSGTISNSYADSSNVAGANYVGGLIGLNSGTLVNSHYNIDGVTINGVAGVVMLGGLFDSTATGGVGQFTDWRTGGSGSRTPLSLDIRNYISTLPGTANSYSISSVQGIKDLLGFSDNAAYTFTLTSNITLPAGLYVPYLSASFDGAGHTIAGLTLNQSNDNLGLFGQTSASAVVQNVVLVGSSVSVPSMSSYAGNLGSLVGDNGGTIRNSFATNGVVTSANGVRVGGLVGSNEGTINNSYAAVTVIGGAAVGGLVGFNNSGTISDSYATGNVNAALNFFGGIVGGLVGQNYQGAISNSYSTGHVSAAGSINGGAYAGGLVGSNIGSRSSISNSFWNTNTSGQSSSSGGAGATGLTSSQMMQASIFSNAGWDISSVGGSTSVWRIYDGQSAPLLRSFLTPITVTANSGARTYDGTTNGLGTSNSVVANSDLLGNATTTLTSRNAGSQTSVASGLYSNQAGYDISYVDGVVTINQASISLTTSNVSKVYDGGLSAAGTAIVSAGTLYANDTLSAGSFAFTDKNVGNGNKTVTTSGVSFNDGNSGANYIVSYVDNTSSSITPKTLTVSGITASDKVYDGTTSATVSTTGVLYSGLVGGDSFRVSATGAFTDPSVASSKTVLLTSTYNGADVGNYQISGQASTTASITAAGTPPGSNTSGDSTSGKTPKDTPKQEVATLPDGDALQTPYDGAVNGSEQHRHSQGEPSAPHFGGITVRDGGIKLPADVLTVSLSN